MINKFLNMSGYALYVWPAYLFVLFVLGTNAWQSTKKLSHILKQHHPSTDKKQNEQARATN